MTSQTDRDGALHDVLAWADSHGIILPRDLEMIDFGPPVRKGLPPDTVQAFIGGQVNTSIQKLLKRILDIVEVNQKYLDLLHGRGIDPDLLAPDEARRQAAVYLADAQAMGERYIRDATAYSARLTASARQYYERVTGEADRRARDREDAPATAPAAKADAGGPGAITDSPAVTALRKLAEMAAGYLRDIETRHPPQAPPEPQPRQQQEESASDDDGDPA